MKKSKKEIVELLKTLTVLREHQIKTGVNHQSSIKLMEDRLKEIEG